MHTGVCGLRGNATICHIFLLFFSSASVSLIFVVVVIVVVIKRGFIVHALNTLAYSVSCIMR